MERSYGDRAWELVEWLAVNWPGQTQILNPSAWRAPDDEAEPPTGPDLQATWRPEDHGDNGEAIGPLIVWDPQKRIVCESDEWMRQPRARELAKNKGVIFLDLS